MPHPLVSRLVRFVRRRPFVSVLTIPAAVYLYLTASYIYWNHDDLYYDMMGVSYSQYKWPLEVDAKGLLRDYKYGNLTIKPITVDQYGYYRVPGPENCDKRKDKGKKLVTVLIKTKVDDRHNRDLLRSTWLADIQQYNLQYSFLIGLCNNSKCEDSLKSELVAHDDMVHGDFIDTYYNNTLKFKMALQYIANYCNQTQYVLIIDGDYYLNVNRLISYLEELNYPADLYAGRLWPSSRPGRDPHHAQYMSYKLYPWRRLPPFIAAGASLLSTQLIGKLTIMAKFTKYLPFDDVFYGMVAKKLNIPLVDATDVLPSWFVPKVDDYDAHRKMVASHRFGNLTEVKMIYDKLHNNDT